MKTYWYSGAGDWGGVGILRSITNSSFDVIGGDQGYKPFSSFNMDSLHFSEPIAHTSLHLYTWIIWSLNVFK